MVRIDVCRQSSVTGSGLQYNRIPVVNEDVRRGKKVTIDEDKVSSLVFLLFRVRRNFSLNSNPEVVVEMCGFSVLFASEKGICMYERGERKGEKEELERKVKEKGARKFHFS